MRGLWKLSGVSMNEASFTTGSKEGSNKNLPIHYFGTNEQSYSHSIQKIFKYDSASINSIQALAWIASRAKFGYFIAPLEAQKPIKCSSSYTIVSKIYIT